MSHLAIALMLIIGGILGLPQAQQAPPQIIQFLQWSPDHQWFLLSLQNGFNKDIYRVSADGSVVGQLTDDPAEEILAAFSPDGEWIIYYLIVDTNPGSRQDMYRMRANGSDKQLLADLGGYVYFESWSPDGEWIIFHVTDGANADLYRMHPDGSAVEKLVDGLDLAREYHAIDSAKVSAYASRRAGVPGYASFSTWSPDGEWIIFSLLYTDWTDLFRMRADGSQVERIAHEGSYDSFVSWSPSQDWMLMISGGVFYSMNPDGTEKHRLTQTPGRNYFLGWSPDHEWIVFEELTEETGRTLDREIYRVRLDGTEQQNLSNSPAFDLFNGFSPDGEWMLFDSFRGGQHRQPYRMNWDTGEITLVSSEISGRFVGFSPDQTWMAYHVQQASGDWEIYIVRPDGSEVRNLTAHPTMDSWESWTPDGQGIIFESFRDHPHGSYYRVNIDDGQIQRINLP